MNNQSHTAHSFKQQFVTLHLYLQSLFPQRLRNIELQKLLINFLDILQKFHVNIPFMDAIFQILNYTKFLKEMLTKKRKLPKHKTMAIFEKCNVIIQHKIPPKLKDPRSFTLPYSIGLHNIHYLIDLETKINLIPLPLYKKLGLRDPTVAFIILQLVDRSLKHPYEIVEGIVIKAEMFIFLVDFVIQVVKEIYQIPIILGMHSCLQVWSCWILLQMRQS